MRLRLAVAIAAAAFAGCGGGSDGESPGATSTPAQAPATTTTGGGALLGRGASEKDVLRAVEAVLTSGDAADACRGYVTRRYLEAAYGDRQGCVQAQGRGSAARKLELKSLRITSDRARVVVVPSGGPYDSERVTVSLLDRGRRWAIDALEANIPVGP